MTEVMGPYDHVVIATEIRDGVAMVSVAGEIDLDSVGQFIDPLLAMAADGVSEFVLDVSGISFIDSTGLSALVRLTKAGGGTNVRLTGVTDRFAELLRMTGLDEIIVAE